MLLGLLPVNMCMISYPCFYIAWFCSKLYPTTSPPPLLQYPHITGQRVAINLDTAQPLQTLLSGQVGVLSVPLYGYPSPTITWSPSHRGNLSFIPVEVYSGVSQLTIPTVTLDDGGVYTVTAENTVHNVSYYTTFYITVDVFVPPSITLLPEIELPELSNEKIPCSVSSKPRPSEIVWSRTDTYTSRTNGDTSRNDQYTDTREQITVEEMVVEEVGNLSVSSRNLVIKEARLEDEGVYMCVARVFIGNRFHVEQRSVRVTVVSATVVAARETNIEAVPGMRLNITCTAQGSPLPADIIWKVNNTVIYGSNLVTFHNSKLNNRKIQSILSIKDLQPEQFGDYECSTFNIVLGHVKSDSVTISVFGRCGGGIWQGDNSKGVIDNPGVSGNSPGGPGCGANHGVLPVEEQSTEI
eukprot:sb/3465196/